MHRQRGGMDWLFELLSLAILIGWGIVLLPGWVRASPPVLQPLTRADRETVIVCAVALVIATAVVVLVKWVIRRWRRK